MAGVNPIARAIGVQVKTVNLVAVKQMRFTFDPFHERALSVRNFLYQLSGPNRRATNLECHVKVDVRSDRTEPSVLVKFRDGHQALLKTANLSNLDILKSFNELCREHEQMTATPKK